MHFFGTDVNITGLSDGVTSVQYGKSITREIEGNANSN